MARQVEGWRARHRLRRSLTGGTEPDGGLGTTGRQARRSAGVRPTGPALGMSAPSSYSSAHTDGAPAWRANSRTSTRGRSPRRGGSRGAAPQRHSEGVAVSGRWVPATLHLEPPLIRIKREDKTRLGKGT